MDGMPFSYNVIADKHPDTEADVVRLWEIDKRKSARISELEAALRLARKWGLSSTGYHGGVAVDLADWVDGGMVGNAPVPPAHLQLITSSSDDDIRKG
jgi:hypothetical protein